MSKIILTEVAVQGLDKCRRFLSRKAPQEAKRAAKAIQDQLLILAKTPQIGQPIEEVLELRKLLIPFND
ncbi:type II toxin-antitoxin system RelE/ParE family toxin [Bartonella apihabitans]|uniref:type II toxin-antitoxin system RelE/ParE family toxin n=1 Tax=Bartonella apihabitans TaxID=2750929 RepID=UPI00098F2367|nr:type II toxin-antitoxin system RelE/ParE family toxin [Bartonella apihabitans]